MLSRLSGNSTSNLSDLQPALFPPGLLQPHEVVEVWGPDSMAVSRLCTHFLSRCLLPSSVGGLAADAIFIDTEHHMQIQQLVASLESTLRKGDYIAFLLSQLKLYHEIMTLLAVFFSTFQAELAERKLLSA